MVTKYLSALCICVLVLNSVSCKEKSTQIGLTSSEVTAIAEQKTADMKKVIRAQVFIKADKISDFLDFTQNLTVQSRAENGNISYTLYQDPSDKTKFIFFEEWANQSAIDFHFNTEHFKIFGETIGDFSSAPSIISIYDVISEK